MIQTFSHSLSSKEFMKFLLFEHTKKERKDKRALEMEAHTVHTFSHQLTWPIVGLSVMESYKNGPVWIGGVCLFLVKHISGQFVE